MHRHVIAGAVVSALLTAGCSSSAVDGVRSALDGHFLEPLRQADVSFAVENTCHLRRDSDAELWHLEVRVRIDADRHQVARILEAEDVVVTDAMVIQQERGNPQGGWNGVLEVSAGGASSLGLTYNNVDIDGVDEAGGWAEVCRLADEPADED
jgi:hypothetical protein